MKKKLCSLLTAVCMALAMAGLAGFAALAADGTASAVPRDNVYLIMEGSTVTALAVGPTEPGRLYGIADEDGNYVEGYRAWQAPSKNRVIFQNVEPGVYSLMTVPAQDATNTSPKEQAGNGLMIKIPFDGDIDIISPQELNRSKDGTVITILNTVVGQQYAIYDYAAESFTTDWVDGNGGNIVFSNLDPYKGYEAATRKGSGEGPGPFTPTIISIHTFPLYGALAAEVLFDNTTGGGQIVIEDAQQDFYYALVTPEGVPLSREEINAQGIVVRDASGEELVRENNGYYRCTVKGDLTFLVCPGVSYLAGYRTEHSDVYYDPENVLTVPAVDKNFELTSTTPPDKAKFNCIISPAYYFCEYAIRLRTTGQLVTPWKQLDAQGMVHFEGLLQSEFGFYTIVARARSTGNLGEEAYNAAAGVTFEMPYPLEPVTEDDLWRSGDGTGILVDPAVYWQQYAVFTTEGMKVCDWQYPEDGTVIFWGLVPEEDYIVNARIPATGTTPAMTQSEGVIVEGIGDVSGGDVSGGDVSGGNTSGGDISDGDGSGGTFRLASVFPGGKGVFPVLIILGIFCIAGIDRLERIMKKRTK